MSTKFRLLVFAVALSACHVKRQASQELHGERSGKQIRESWEAERKRESARFTDAELARMVDRLFIEEDPNRANFHGLLWAGSRPVPFLIKALDEPRTWSTVFFREGFHPDGQSPFERICWLLDDTAPAEAAKPLARYLAHPDPKFRREAASVLGSIGTLDCLEPIKTALADPDLELREYAMMGLMHGVERQSETFRHNIFVAIDAAQAAPILESSQYLAASNPQLHQVLTALDREGVKVPLAIVMPLLAELEELAVKNEVREADYATALILYARNPDKLAESRFQVLTGSPSSTIAAAGARGLEILAGIDPSEAAWAAFEQRGFAAMTIPQRFYHAIEDYRDEVNNGGHEQYFYNSDSDVYETAIDGLRTIGATSKAAILSGAAHAFVPLGPAATNAERRRQMELFGAPQDRIFKSADARFWASEKRPGERLDVLLAQYALQHKNDFAPVAGAPRKRSMSGQAGVRSPK